MQELLTLSKLLNHYTSENTLPNSRFNSKYNRLYRGILKEEIKSDNEAQILLYDGKKTNAYRVFKNRYKNLIRKQINNINVVDKMISANSRIRQTIHENQKLFSLINTSFNLKEAYYILKKIYNSSLEIGDVSLILESSLKLYEYSKVWNIEKGYQESLLKLIYEHKEFLIHKIEIIKVYSYFNSLISAKKNLSNIKLDTEIIITLKNVKSTKTPDYYSRHKLYSSLYYYYFIQENIKEIIPVCKNALSFFSKKYNLNKYGYFSFSIKYAYVLMHMNEHKKAKVYFDKMLDVKISRKQSIWLNINMYAIKNLIYLSEYKQASIRLIDVTQHSSYKKVKTPYFTEIYKIKEAYLNVLLKMKLFTIDDAGIKKIKPFRINKFLNEVPTYSKDKRGSNISILIIHIFYLFINKKYDLILDRLEALKAYSHRYLRNDDSLRSNAFIKILLQLPSAHYHPTSLKRHANKYYNKMINAPLHLAARHIEVEVIPYEKQYELLTELLQMRLDNKI